MPLDHASALPLAAPPASDAAVEALAAAAATALIRLLPADALLATLLRALDPARCPDADWAPIRAFCSARMPDLMKSAGNAVDGALRADATELLSALDNESSRGDAARARFAETLGQPQWSAAALGFNMAPPAKGAAPENPRAFERKNHRRSAFGRLLVSKTKGRFDPQAWSGWSLGAIFHSLWEDMTAHRVAPTETVATLKALRERGLLEGWDWQLPVRAMLARARSDKPGAASRHANSLRAIPSLASAFVDGVDALRLYRCLNERDYPPSAIAQLLALKRDVRPRFDLLVASGIVPDATWRAVLDAPNISPAARACVEALALGQTIHEAHARPIPLDSLTGETLAGQIESEPAHKTALRL